MMNPLRKLKQHCREDGEISDQNDRCRFREESEHIPQSSEEEAMKAYIFLND